MNEFDFSVARVGVGVSVFKDGTILLGKRHGSHGAGEYACPGGHLDYMESFEETARRELAEECGVGITNLTFQFVANIKTYAPRHYIHINFRADWESGEPQLLAPEESEPWQWYPLDALPEPLFETARLAIQSEKSGARYFDAGA